MELRGAHQRRLLGILTAADGRVVSTDRLVDQLWDEAPPDAAARTFRTYVARLRRSLEAAGAIDGGDLVVTDAPGYRLARDVATDADEFGRAVEEGRDSLAVGEAASAWNRLNDALGLWSGDALGEFADEEWASATAIRLEELRLAARELHIRAQLDLGNQAEAIAEIDALVAEHPLRETPRRDLMVALYRDGRHAEALRAGREYSKFLADETGLEPSAAITDVEAMIIERDPRLDAVPEGRRRRGYLLEEPIADGPLGVVYRARQPSIGRDVAITVIPAEFADDPSFVQGFEGRAQLVASVEHASVVPIYDYWREPGGAYLVVRHYPGGTLADRFAAGPIPPDEAAAVTRQMAAALRAAHQRGVAHGNVEASTVWFDDQGDAVLGGFGMVSGVATNQGDLADLADLVESMIVAGAAIAEPVADVPVLSNLVRRLRDPEGSVATASDVLIELDEVVPDTNLAGDTPQASGIELSHIVGPNPFKGLAAFSEADADLFFGREAIVDEVADVLRRRRVAALVGPSGSGKSSVMRAGLLPMCRAAGSYVTTMVPGTRPLDELEVALTRIAAAPLQGLASELATEDGRMVAALRSIVPDPDREIVLAIDQFEELFTISRPEERDRFLDVLVEAHWDTTTNISVVVTCRADFLGRVLDHPVAGQLLRDRSVLITPLTSEELHDAVIGPAEQAGIAVEPALVAEVVGDAAGSPGSLPMVQYVLTETFEAATDDGVMTLQDYRRLGGVSGALAQRAEEVYGGLGTDDQKAARRLFSRLVAPGEESGPTRRRARRTELTTVSEPVVDAFGRARLVSFDRDPATREPTVEVSHEALIRNWPRLVAWIEEERDGLRLLGHVTLSADEWMRSDRDSSLVYRGARLVAAEQWADEHRGELSDVESDFLASSTDARDAENEREQKSVRRLRGLTVGLALFLALALVAAAVAVVAQRRADDRSQDADDARSDALAAQQVSDERATEADAARNDAEAAQAESDATRRDAEVAALAANARVLASSDPVTAMLIALQASARGSGDEPAVTSALLDSLSADPRERSLYPPVQSSGLGLQPDAGPFYTYVFNDGGGARIDVVNVDDGTTRTVDLDFLPFAALTEPSGRFLFSVSSARLLLHDTVTGVLLSDEPVENYLVSEASLDGNDLAVAYPDGRIVVHALPDFEVLTSIEGLVGMKELTRSRDGRVVAVLDTEGNALVASVDGSDERWVVPLGGPFEHVQLDATGDRLAVSRNDGPTVLFDLTAPEAAPVTISAGTRTDLEFSPDGRLLGVATSDGIEVFDVGTGEPAADPVSFASAVTFWFTGNRALQAFASNQGVVAIELDAQSRTATLTTVPGWGGVGFLSPDLSGVVALADDEDGVFTQYFVRAPTDPERTTWTPIGPTSDTWTSRPLLDEGFITVDTARLRYEEWDDAGLVQTIDLTGGASQDYHHFLAPRIGKSRDILILAERGEVVLGSEVIVIDRANGQVLLSLRDRNVVGAEFSGENEDEIIVGYTDGRVRWLDLDGNPVADDVVVGAAAGAFAVTPDRSLTAVGDWSGIVTLLDEDHEVIAELVNDAPFPIRMAFIGDGAQLVVQSEDGSIVLWDVASASRIGTLYRTDGVRGAFEVAPDGSSIVVATEIGIADISVDLDEWIRIACETADRALSDAELRSVVPGLEPIDDPCTHFE
ncbi:MAG: BTAD domain-containing putative transcriptional regulator [Ilumatobacteraceae bacterium]